MITLTFFCCFVGFIIAVNIIVLVVNVGIMWSAGIIHDEIHDKCKKLCFPCENEMYGGQICCDCRINSLTTYLQQVFRLHMSARDLKTSQSRDTTGPRTLQLKSKTVPQWMVVRPAARLIGSKQQHSTNERKSGLTTLKSWKKGRRCFMDKGIIFRNGRIVVPLKGTYHVYSVLNLFKISNESASPEPKIAIYKFNILDMTERLLSDSYSLQKRNTFYSVSNMYIGFDVRLNASDEVFVKVTDTNFIKNPSTNTFGVYML